MSNINDAKNKLMETNGSGLGNKSQSQQKFLKVSNLLEKMRPAIEQALPKHVDPNRISRIALTSIRMNPKLLQCSELSLLGAILQCSQLGLEPNIFGQCYLIPYKNKKNLPNGQITWVDEVQFQIGYRGYIELFYRTDSSLSIGAYTVYANDEFDYAYGLEQNLVHKPCLTDRGEVIAYYSVAKMKNGAFAFVVASKKDIEEHSQKFSKAVQKGWTSPWKTNFDEMAKKTVIKKVMKYLPLSVELQKQFSADSTIKEASAELVDMFDAPELTNYEVLDGDDDDDKAKGIPAPITKLKNPGLWQNHPDIAKKVERHLDIADKDFISQACTDLKIASIHSTTIKNYKLFINRMEGITSPNSSPKAPEATKSEAPEKQSFAEKMSPATEAENPLTVGKRLKNATMWEKHAPVAQEVEDVLIALAQKPVALMEILEKADIDSLEDVHSTTFTSYKKLIAHYKLAKNTGPTEEEVLIFDNPSIREHDPALSKKLNTVLGQLKGDDLTEMVAYIKKQYGGEISKIGEPEILEQIYASLKNIVDKYGMPKF
jgi:recombination protein RecT